MDWIAVAGGLIIAYLLYSIYKAWQESRAPPPPPAKWMVGDPTAESLAFHNGYDWSKPTCLAVEGVIYDVSKSGDLYGPGALEMTINSRQQQQAGRLGTALSLQAVVLSYRLRIGVPHVNKSLATPGASVKAVLRIRQPDN
eukprot:GHUV01044986.1.p1 GENE.GHUV01044986.1~~GHUV01044986.1.p1  ORF type:complete len:141 (-),score=8.30 GHUV01044986.1:134-556(-)